MALVAATDDALRGAISAGSATLAYYSPRGQEAVAAGFAAALAPDDYLVTTYRGLHDQIAKGVPLRPLAGRDARPGRGHGQGQGRPHARVVARRRAHADHGRGRLGPSHRRRPGLGGRRARGQGRVTVASFGDGATNIGAFHEAANLAAVWGLPVIFLCQNNGYGEHTAFADHLRVEHVARTGRRLRHARRDRRRQRSRGRLRGRVGGGGARPGGGGAHPRRGGDLPALRPRLRRPHGLCRSRRARRGVEARARGPLPPRPGRAGVCSPTPTPAAVEERCATTAAATLAEVLELPEPGADEVLTDVVAAPQGRDGAPKRQQRARGAGARRAGGDERALRHHPGARRSPGVRRPGGAPRRGHRRQRGASA